MTTSSYNLITDESESGSIFPGVHQAPAANFSPEQESSRYGSGTRKMDPIASLSLSPKGGILKKVGGSGRESKSESYSEAGQRGSPRRESKVAFSEVNHCEFKFVKLRLH